MHTIIKSLALLLATATSFASAQDRQDQAALDVLTAMSAYTGVMERIVVNAEVYSDARMSAGLMVSNAENVQIKLERPSSLYVRTTDTKGFREIYIHEGSLTVYNSETNFYAIAEVPKDIESAMDFAVENFELETPFGELFFSESAAELLKEQDEVIYLSDDTQVRGVNCHQLAIRGELADLQLWVAKGDKPTVERMSMSMKWDGGSPRNVAFLEWASVRKFNGRTFEFTPPGDALQIPFYGSN